MNMGTLSMPVAEWDILVEKYFNFVWQDKTRQNYETIVPYFMLVPKKMN